MEILTEGQYFGENLKLSNNGIFELSLTQYRNDSFIANHCHTNNYLSILIEGSYIEKNDQDTLLVSAGDILFRPKTYNHQNTFNNSIGTCFNVEFMVDWEQKLGVKFKLPDQHVKYQSASMPSLYKLLIGFKGNANLEANSEFIYDWLFAINQKTIDRSSLSCVEKVSKILENELCQYHSLTKIAERVHVHPVYLARAFKEKKGLTLGEYQLRSKLTNAISLLLNTSKTISSISFANGFYDDAHFIRSFKAVYKISPHQFRLRIKS